MRLIMVLLLMINSAWAALLITSVVDGEPVNLYSSIALAGFSAGVLFYDIIASL